MNYKTLLPTLLSVFMTVLLLQQPIQAQSDNTSQATALKGRIITERVHSPALEGALLHPSATRSVSVYLPPYYDERPDALFSVVYVLNPWWGNHDFFIERLGGQATLDAYFNQNGAQNMILVFPNGFNQFQGSWFINSPVAGNWADFITDDLVSYIDFKYRTIPDAASRGIAGFATGGYGAITLGMKRPDLFQAVYGLASTELVLEESFLKLTREELNRVAANPANFTDFPALADFERLVVSACVAFAPDATATPLMCKLPVDVQGAVVDSLWQKWLQNDPYTMLTKPEYKQNLLQLKGLAFDCGTQVNVYDATTRFRQALTDAGIPYNYHEYVGGYHHRLDERMRDTVLTFFSDLLYGTIYTATEQSDIPDEYRLSANYPNPFNPTTTLSYALPHPSDVTLTVYDVLGRQIRVLATGIQPAGTYDVSFDATGLPSGLYVYRLQAGSYVETKRMVVLR